MTPFVLALGRVAGVTVFVWVAGFLAAGALVPSRYRLERAGWGFAIGTGLVAAAAAGLAAPWAVLLVLIGVAVVVGLRFRIATPAEMQPALPPAGRLRPAGAFWIAAAILGVALYGLRALTEPMWSGDYLAIWGLKGKSFFAGSSFARHLFEDPSFGFSHPEYPVGLPLLYAGIGRLSGSWDDHALALLFPLWLIATLLVLYGFLRRRGAPPAVAWGAVALLTNFEALYSAFLTGMAEVPVSFAFLLLACALADAWEDTDRGALRRVAFASLLAAATKNEGLLLVGLAFLITWLVLFRRPRAGARLSLALLLPAGASALLHRAAFGRHPLRDFDLSLLRSPELPARFFEGMRAFFELHVWPSRYGVLLLAALILAGRGVPAANRMLLLAAAALAVYLVLPSLAVQGPRWLATWSLGRTAAALVPLAAAATALRLSELYARPRT